MRSTMSEPVEKTVLTLEDLYSDNVLAKGRKLLESGKVVQDADRPSVFEVRGSRPYTVTHIETTPDDEDGNPQDDQGIAWLACTCPNGSARGARPNCYHTAAVLLFIRDNWEEVREEVWGQSLADKVNALQSPSDESDLTEDGETPLFSDAPEAHPARVNTALSDRDAKALRLLNARKMRLTDDQRKRLWFDIMFEMRQTGEGLTDATLDKLVGVMRRDEKRVEQEYSNYQRQVDALLDNRSPAQVEEDELETLQIIVSSNRHGKVHAPALPAFDEVEHLAYPHTPGTLPGTLCAGCAEMTNGETNG